MTFDHKNSEDWHESRTYEELEELTETNDRAWYSITVTTLVIMKVLFVLVICFYAIRALLLKNKVRNKWSIISIFVLNIIVLIGKI